jgi:hypothetical protein
MGGGLLQLVAYGAQDVYLTGNPQITFFKVVYRRHTNFALESIVQTFNGVTGFGNTVYCTVSRNGDLINRVYLQLDLPPLADSESATHRYVNYIGNRIINNVTIEIGGQQIDKHYSDWLYIWNELSLPIGKKYGYEMMVGADGDITSTKNTFSASDVSNNYVSTLYVPLEFWFCRNVGLALPLIALQYHEVKFKIQFEEMDKCIYNIAAPATSISSSATFPNKTFNSRLWIDYIFLDTDERRRFAQLSHEYLIEQLQFTGDEKLNVGTGNRFKLNFNHPTKELIWVAKCSENVSKNRDWYNYTVDSTYTNEGFNVMNYSGGASVLATSSSNVIEGIYPSGKNPVDKCLLQLNGNDRFAERDGIYFNSVQPFQHHTNIPVNKGINVYSFALKPEEHQPSGTLNMSRIDTAVLSMNSLKEGTVSIYAVNYNVLRIMSGMGGLAYSN